VTSTLRRDEPDVAHQLPEPIRLPDRAWSDPDVRRLCAETDAIGLIRHITDRYPVTQGRIAYWMGIDSGAMSRLLNDTGRVVKLDRWRSLADALNMPPANRLLILGGRGDEVPGPPGGREVQSRRYSVAPTRLAISRSALAAAAEESATFGEWAETANAARFSVEQLTADVRNLAFGYLTGPPVPVFLGARAVRDKAAALLRGHSAPGRSSDLYALAGYACTLLAWISGDLGQLGAADTHGRTAWLCADLADSDELRAWVLSTRSKTAFWDGRLAEAADLARAGSRLATSSSVAVLLAAQEADVAAEMGRPDEARRLLGSATEALDRVTRTDTVGGLLSCGSARLGNYAAGVYVRTGQPDDALRETDAALAAYASGEPRAHGTEMQLHVSRALVYLHTGALDGAAEALGPVLATPAEQRLATVAGRLSDVATVLEAAPYDRSKDAIALRRAIADFRSHSAALTMPQDPQEDDE
jgi:hypothetical protein